MRAVLHLGIAAALTALTQLGGFAWLLALLFRRRWLAFIGLYAALWLGAFSAAPLVGRVPLPCLPGGALQVASPLYCVLNRHYATPVAAQTMNDLADAVADAFPGTVTLALDAGFPFWDGFAMPPHLSHNDGAKVDLAFYYAGPGGEYLPGRMRSPIGYFAFEDGPSNCTDQVWDFRWNFRWLQPVWPDWRLEPERMRFALRWLARDERVARMFLEPHLETRLGVASGKIRFQGCRAARHDDHLHVEIRG